MPIATFDEVIQLATARPPITVSVAAAHDVEVLKSIQHAMQQGFVRPYLVGKALEIEQMMLDLGMDFSGVQVIPADSDEEAAYRAAALANDGTADCVMKGLINSSVFLRGILNKDFQLRTDSLLSHVSIFEVPNFPRLLYLADGGLNVAPDLQQKEQILRNTIGFLNRMGLERPRVALLSANETVMPGMPVTVEADILAQRANEGAYGPAIVDGPLPLDLAISPEAAQHKHIMPKTEGRADLLFAPTIEVGNILGKAITYFGGGTMAGVVLGAKIPLVLTSRADSNRAKMVSLAFTVLEAAHRANTSPSKVGNL